MKIIIALFVLTFSITAFSHSGGTNADGCHAGTRPYHCHNGGSDSSNNDLVAWDANLGYQYHVKDTNFTPYIGLSIGDNGYGDTTFGGDIGLMHSSSVYLGYVTTSESIQIGYAMFHLSINEDTFGLGMHIPFSTLITENVGIDNTSIYFSASGLLGEDKEYQH